MDVVERVHEEVGVDLIAQILQLLGQVLPLERRYLLPHVVLLEVELHSEVESEHEEEHYSAHHVGLSEEQGRSVARSLRWVSRGAVGRLAWLAGSFVVVWSVVLCCHLGLEVLVVGRSKVGTGGTLREEKRHHERHNRKGILQLLLLIYKNRCGKGVVNDEGGKIDSEHPPHVEHVFPSERAVSHHLRFHVFGHYGRHEEQRKQKYVEEVFLLSEYCRCHRHVS